MPHLPMVGRLSRFGRWECAIGDQGVDANAYPETQHRWLLPP
jgi:hypothetical protein